MSRIMLIDASHQEQTRVVVTDKNRVVEFDLEVASKKQTIGNIYLAKITRVEPSLQAAFVEYGEGRQGFLPFSEIHPDYYQIPLEDRNRLLEEQAARYRAETALRDAQDDAIAAQQENQNDESVNDDSEQTSKQKGDITHDNDVISYDAVSSSSPEITLNPVTFDDDDGMLPNPLPLELDGDNDDGMLPNPLPLELDGDNDDMIIPQSFDTDSVDIESVISETFTPRAKKYKIQEVIKKRQILLVQVVKGERGNKGASLTTYLSLAGKYCVLMPNTAHGGGISRKITQSKDRQALKKIVSELDITAGMGLIVRTAGANRTKIDIKRDYEYLMRLWETVRDLTMASTAPSLVYEEGSLIKRSIRDIYTKDVSKIYVQGHDGFQEAEEFMELLMPSHVRNVVEYKDPLPLFSRYQVEKQLEEFTHRLVQLRSGGYLVIDQTEALVAIDINSGRSTNEFSVEDTALKTNLEAADEIARQLRMRDLAGLVVIDFIDMEDYRNVRAVEKRMKDAVKNDKARIQLARISNFGLMEMTRQRLRPAMQDSMSNTCPHCKGAGYIVSDETAALRILRRIFEEVAVQKPASIAVKTEMNIANFILNKKRAMLAAFEQNNHVEISIEGSVLLAATDCEIISVARENGMVGDDKKIVFDTTERTVPVRNQKITDTDASEPHQRKRRRSRGERDDNDNHIDMEHDSIDNIDSKRGQNKNNKNRFEKNIDTHATKESQWNNKRRGRFMRYTTTPEIFVTDTGIDVVIENPVSVLEPSDLTAVKTNLHTENSNDNDISVIVESVDTVTHIALDSLSEMTDADSTSPTDKKNAPKKDNKKSTARPKKTKKTVNNSDENQLDNQNIDTEITEKSVSETEHEQSAVPEIKITEPTVTDTHTPEKILENAVVDTDIPNSEPPKPARRGWWRDRFGI